MSPEEREFDRHLIASCSRVSRKQIEQQLTQCLEKYRGLALRLDDYAPDGSTNEPTNMALLALEGTIPMSYRDKLYNIPVSVSPRL